MPNVIKRETTDSGGQTTATVQQQAQTQEGTQTQATTGKDVTVSDEATNVTTQVAGGRAGTQSTVEVAKFTIAFELRFQNDNPVLPPGETATSDC